MELVVKTDLEKEVIRSIDWNFKELEKQVSAGLEKYKGRVVTPETIKDDKKDVAALRKLRTAIEDKRKEVKSACLRPYDDFEAKEKPIIALIDECIDNISEQTKAFEAAEKEEKRTAIEEFYKQNIKSLYGLVPFETLFEERWLNKSVLITTATGELYSKIEKANGEILTIRGMKLAPECETRMLDTYVRTLSIGAALEEKARFEEQQAKLEELKKNQQAAIKAEPEAQPVHVQEELVKEQETEQPRDLWLKIRGTTKACRQEINAIIKKYGLEYEGGLINGDS
ncbi:DUF1351 domain-containing protein [Ruminococcaceae bacterium OttesenSCG-928-A16]|nr:DUF1351 domain-containing protein [Ruminococcaceae bacterium OttesenSCG-928-A16]